MTNTKKDFKGKVVYYSNLNGQEKKLEKEFDSQDDMNTYVEEHNISFPSLFQPMSLGGFGALNSWFDSFFDNKLSRMGYTPQSRLPIQHDSKFNELQRKKIELEEEESRKQERKKFLEKKLEDWKELKAFFTKKNDTESVKKAEEGIEECEEQLKDC